MDIITEVVKVTPEIAQTYLENARANRNISERTVKKYADAMRKGKWVCNGEALKFNQEGQMIDGRHRCTASMVADTPFDTLVVHGLPDESFDSLDSGYKRVLSHYLSTQGEKQTAVLAAAIRFCIEYERDMLFLNSDVSSHDGLVWLERNPDIRKYTNLSNHLGRLIQPSIAVGLCYIFSRLDPDEAELFFMDLGSGENLSPKDPVFKLRKRLLENQMSKKTRLTRRSVIALTIKAWNFRRTRREIRQLTFQDVEEFPRAI